MFQIEDGAVEEIQHQITVLVDEYKDLEQRGSQMEVCWMPLKFQIIHKDFQVYKEKHFVGTVTITIDLALCSYIYTCPVKKF